jgi:cytochrome c oxidase cbb3-type subunit 3
MPTNPDDDRLLDHNYDGIQEYDNPLPRWWVWIFWATIAFSLLYVLDPTARIRGPGRVAEYGQQIAAAEARWPKGLGAADATALDVASRDPRLIADGKVVFTTYCAACHRADGGGIIGPNLTDEYWLHGSQLTDVQRTVMAGVLDKGMPAWEKVLKSDQVTSVISYVWSLRGTRPVDPKPPQGVKADTVEAKSKS